MDIKKITDFKPDTELRSENPFERTEIDRARKRYDEPEAKKSKIVSSEKRVKCHRWKRTVLDPGDLTGHP